MHPHCLRPADPRQNGQCRRHGAAREGIVHDLATRLPIIHARSVRTGAVRAQEQGRRAGMVSWSTVLMTAGTLGNKVTFLNGIHK